MSPVSKKGRGLEVIRTFFYRLRVWWRSVIACDYPQGWVGAALARNPTNPIFTLGQRSCGPLGSLYEILEEPICLPNRSITAVKIGRANWINKSKCPP